MLAFHSSALGTEASVSKFLPGTLSFTAAPLVPVTAYK